MSAYQILEFEEDRIRTQEDLPCWFCAVAPVEQVYIPVRRGASHPRPDYYAQSLRDGGWVDVYVIGSRVCILIEQQCLNKRCLTDRNSHPLDKLARCSDPTTQKASTSDDLDILDLSLKDGQ